MNRVSALRTASPGQPLPSYELAGFVALPDETPILDEEERYAEPNLVRTYPQWGGDIVGRWSLGNGWAAAEPQRRCPLGQRRQAAIAEGPGRGFDPAPWSEGLPAVSDVRTDADAATPGQGSRWGRNAKAGKTKQDDIGHTEGCPKRRQQPGAAGHQHVRANRSAAVACAGAGGWRAG